jgi:hypothetical protein
LNCAQEKFEEFAMVMRALGAKTMAVNSTSELNSIAGNKIWDAGDEAMINRMSEHRWRLID